jgi:hypothetical protein
MVSEIEIPTLWGQHPFHLLEVGALLELSG